MTASGRYIIRAEISRNERAPQWGVVTIEAAENSSHATGARDWRAEGEDRAGATIASQRKQEDRNSHKLILGILEVLGEVGESFEALAESHGELSDYVESIDEDLADLEADLYDDEDEDLAEDEDGTFEGSIEYECPHCGTTVEIDPDEVDFDEDALCPQCGKELFPELPEEGLDGEPEEEE